MSLGSIKGVLTHCACFFFLSHQDLEGKIIVDELKQEVISTNSKAEPPQCTSLAWSADGQVSLVFCVFKLVSEDPGDYKITWTLKPHGESPAIMRGRFQWLKEDILLSMFLTFNLCFLLYRHCSLATLTIWSECGRSPLEHDKRIF